PEAFAEVYDHQVRSVLAFFYRRTADAWLAADLTAETFAEAFASRWRYRRMSVPAEAWIFGIARNQLRRALRRGRASSRARRRIGLERLEVDDVSLERIEDLIDLQPVKHAMEQALGTMNPGVAQALRLRVGLEMIPYLPVKGDSGTRFDHLPPRAHDRGCGGRSPRFCRPSRADGRDMSHGDLVRGRPPLLLAPPPSPHVLRHGEAAGDDRLRLGPVGGPSIEVADHVRRATNHGGPEPTSKMRRHDRHRLVVVGAALDHLHVVDPGELRVELSRGVGGPHEHAPKPPIAGLGHGLALAVGLPGLRGSRHESHVGGVAVSGREPLGPTRERDGKRRSHPDDARDAARELGGIDLSVALLPASLQGTKGGLGHLQPRDLGGELLSQDLE